MPGGEGLEIFQLKNQTEFANCLRQARGWVETAGCKNSGASETPCISDSSTVCPLSQHGLFRSLAPAHYSHS